MCVIDSLPTVAGAHDAARWRSLPGWTTVAGKSLSLEFQVYGLWRMFSDLSIHGFFWYLCCIIISMYLSIHIHVSFCMFYSYGKPQTCRWSKRSGCHKLHGLKEIIRKCLAGTNVCIYDMCMCIHIEFIYTSLKSNDATLPADLCLFRRSMNDPW